MRNSVILDEGRLRETVAYFRTQPAFAFDVEGMGEHRGVAHLAELSWLSMATKGCCVVIPFGHPVGSAVTDWVKVPRLCQDGKTRQYKKPVYEPPPPQLDRALVFDILRPLFFDQRIVKSAHGAVYDLTATAKYFGEVIIPPYNDTIIQSWLLDENRKRHGLKYLVKDFFSYDYDQESVGKEVEKYPFDMVAHYSYCDAKYAWLLYRRFTPLVEGSGLTRVYDLEMDILNVLVGMRLAGARVDIERLRQLKTELTERKGKVRAELIAQAGRDFNPNSTRDKQRMLFGVDWVPDAFPETQGLRPWKMTDTGRKQKKAGERVTAWSTDDEVLESYQGVPVVDTLREYQETHKLLSTYVLAYLGEPERGRPVQVYDGRVHADFVQYGTTTRRFSCRDPNLQNIPRPDTELGKLIRGAFQADPGWKLIVGDYGQIELVMFAHFILGNGGHGALVDAFLNGEDPHQATADKLGIIRQMGKTINFSISYGATEKKIASLLGVPARQAQLILADHREMFPEIYDLKRAIVHRALKFDPPRVTTILGGQRRLIDLTDQRDWVRERAERQAVSSVIQGSAADLIKLAMVRADRLTAGTDIEMTLTVHDEIVLTAPEEQADKAAELLREAMLGKAIQSMIKVPLTADIKVVDRWSEAK